MSQPIWDKWAIENDSAQLLAQAIPHNFGENPSSGYRDMGSISLAAAHPSAQPR